MYLRRTLLAITTPVLLAVTALVSSTITAVILGALVIASRHDERVSAARVFLDDDRRS